MPITPGDTQGFQRLQRSFKGLFGASLVALTIVIVIFSVLDWLADSLNQGRSPWPWIALDPRLPGLPLGVFLVLGAIGTTVLLMLAALTAPLSLLVCAYHLLLVDEPPIPLEPEQAGEIVLAMRARLRPPGEMLGAAGRLYLTRNFLVFVPNRYRMLAWAGAPVEEVIIPLEEIASMTRTRTGMKLTRRSGDLERFSLWNTGQLIRCIEQVRAGQTPPEALQTYHRRRWRFLLALLASSLVFWLGWHACLRLAAAGEYARIRAEGLPVTPEELDAFFPAPRGENRAAYYEKAAKLWSPTSDLTIQLFNIREPQTLAPESPLPGLVRADAEELRARHPEVLSLLRQARGIPDCRFFGVLSDQGHPMGPHVDFMDLARLQYLLELQARLAAERGDADEAAESILDMIAIARSLDRSPESSRIQSLNALLYRPIAALEACASRAHFTDDQLARLAAEFRAAVPPLDSSLDVAINRCYFLRVVNERTIQFPPHPFERWETAIQTALSTIMGLRDVDRLAVLQRSRVAMAIKPSLRPERQTEWPPREDQVPYFHGAGHVSSVVWVFESAHQSVRAVVGVAVAAIAVQRYRLGHGEWPERLQQLVPEFLDKVPADPYADQALRYRRTESGAVVYSAFQDHRDGYGRSRRNQGSTTRPSIQPEFDDDDDADDFAIWLHDHS